MANLDFFIVFTLCIIVILVSTQVIGRGIMMIGQPAVVGEMIAGVLLGPTLFGYFFPEHSANLFSKEIIQTLYVFCNLGLAFYMFMVGMEIDFTFFNKSTIKVAALLSVNATLIPFLIGCAIGWIYHDTLAPEGVPIVIFSIFLGIAFSITAFPMLARILEERDILHSKIGVISIISASFQDVASWILLAFITAYLKNGSLLKGFAAILGGLAFLLLIFFVIKPILEKISNHVQTEKKLKPLYFSIVIFFLLTSTLVTDYIGLYSVFGGFVLGLSIPRNKFFIDEIKSRFKEFTVILLLPIFFVFSGLNANMLILKDFSTFLPCVIIILFAIIGKYGVSTLTIKSYGFTWGESSAIGGLLNARGLMDLLVANIGIFYGIIDIRIFSILVLLAIITTLMATPIFNLSFKDISYQVFNVRSNETEN